MATKGYKGSINQKCETLRYELGKTYSFHGKIELCHYGFHFCKDLGAVFEHYPFSKDFVLMEVKALGRIIKGPNKCVTDKIKITKIFSREEVFELTGFLVEEDAAGNVIHFKSSEIEYWQTFDAQGNTTYYKDSQGKENWWRYDINKNLIYQKDSFGKEAQRRYDSQNNLIYFKDPYGREVWQKYGSNGNLLGYESKDKKWHITVED